MRQPALQYRYITRASPVQAEGTVSGRPFFFHAKYHSWSFAVSERPGVDPVDIQIADRAAEQGGWLREGTIGSPREARASYLSKEDADAIIQQCAEAYVAERAMSEG